MCCMQCTGLELTCMLQAVQGANPGYTLAPAQTSPMPLIQSTETDEFDIPEQETWIS